MRKMRICGLLALTMCVLVIFTVATTAHAQTVSVLYNFGAKNQDPLDPESPGVVAQGRNGNLYSTTQFGGRSVHYGTAFTITSGGKLTELHSFDGSQATEPFSGLTLGTDGNFYGTTLSGGHNGRGTIFRMTPKGQLTVLHDFTGTSDGGHPYAPPIEGLDGNFYGTTTFSDQGYGTVYAITPSGTLTTLCTFNGSNGSNPFAPLVLGTDSNFYGTTMFPGTVYKVTPTGQLTTLHQFDCNQGCAPQAALIQASDGNFYGTASEGGAGSAGVVFQITPSGTYTVLHDFQGTDQGAYPTAGLVQATDGNFYGVTPPLGGTQTYGTIYKITPSGTFTVLYSFGGKTGNAPKVTLFQHTNGKFYGDTYQGGSAGFGVFYRLDLGLKPFVSLLPTAGKVGESIGVLGQRFTGTTAVSFNGTAAKFTVSSDTFLTATVPSGATTGFVTVATPKGKLTSNQQFRVIQ